MTQRFFGMPPAQLAWSTSGEPQDVVTGDVYFSVNDGLAETKTVFLQACNLPERWQVGASHTITELGFGTGLNFLASCALWKQQAKPGQTLHYISVEGFPLTLAELTRAHKKFPELADEATALQANWPPSVKGFHRLFFAAYQVELILLFGPAEQMLQQLNAQVDSWFLDGFAPAKNQQMWSDGVFEQIARLSAPAARIGTYTVAGFVRRGLAKAGFEVQKKSGHGNKRQRLEAIYPGAAIAPICRSAETVMVIGGGIAGACVAHELRQSGMDCLLVEADKLAAGASGNPIGLVSPRLDLEDSALARFYRCAFVYACQFYQQNCPDAFGQNGLLRLAETPEQQQKFADLAQAAALPPALLEWQQTANRLLLKTAGVLDPVAAISQLSQTTKIIKAEVTKLSHDGKNWLALDANQQQIASAKSVVLATGAVSIAALQLPPFRILRGQVSWAAGIKNIPDIARIGKTYLTKLAPDKLLFGATHERVDVMGDSQIRAHDHQTNLAGLANLAPELAAQINPKILQGRTSYRAASPDLQPMAGPVADANKISAWSKQHWGKLHDYSTAPVLPNLYLLNGLGSRGLTLAPLLARFIISQITTSPSPLEQQAATALHPARFAARAARK
ncbi:tRNA (5-methylaminomethyl-2-thiouridylate)-methyltransferase / FAD-dependent cmnm(5)s(2)U34 oxidoreductase [hydrothermal vent metagenome]|uniref:tRNA (5-methylaminomethyl-2-thiouridylate)-methyltransferase / FAD-dependent cmnm(5)s(2)U34 oxidoreductase n=1 Tax=hydrothermal vent metagenome TaxID=652676 RepID=A0A3B0R0X5_9ZZZZ